MVAFGTVHNWNPGEGSVISWHASSAARHKAQNAPISAIPPSYQQIKHLQLFREHAAKGCDITRLNIGAWDIPGACNVPAMTEAINAHLRRHDTYHSWFEYSPSGEVFRRTFDNPADIEFLPLERGHMAPDALRADILATPNPLRWDCFTFGLVQHLHHFTFYVSADHRVIDGMSVCLIFLEIHLTYAALVANGRLVELPEAGSHDDYCARQHQHAAALTLRSPEVRDWLQFMERNSGLLPRFPLPLGDPSIPCGTGVIAVALFDNGQADGFEAACAAMGARFSGGVIACAAFAEYELTGAETYYGITPYDARSTPAEFLTPGWFTGYIPVALPVAGTSFGAAVSAAQSSLDLGIDLAYVPFGRVVELTSAGSPNGKHVEGSKMLSYADARGVPLSSHWDELNIGMYGDGRSSNKVCIYVNRFAHETTLTISFPQNPIARESVERYAQALKATMLRVAGRGAGAAAMQPLAPPVGARAAGGPGPTDQLRGSTVSGVGATHSTLSACFD
ncbi:condensation domain-containing protein [Mycobacterium paraffinicum]|uniref:condensation domain-containing protein n=1 Tax=Mycobacterium paraffinicum TaxID=53378 RepID=UPI000AF1FE72